MTEQPNPPINSDDDDLRIPAFLDRREYDADGKMIQKPIPSWVITAGSAVQPRQWAPIKTREVRAAERAAAVAKETNDGVDLFQKITGSFKPLKPPKADKPAAVPKEPGRARVEGRPGTRAEVVRGYIREAMAKGETPESVMLRCGAEPLNMREKEAQRYVTENWARVLKIQQMKK